MQIKKYIGKNIHGDTHALEVIFDKPIDPSLIEMVDDYHPIFLERYEVNSEKAVFVSHLLFLWEGIADVLNKEANSFISRDEAVDLIRNTYIKRSGNSMSAISLIEAAIGHDIEIHRTVYSGAELPKIDGARSFYNVLHYGVGQSSFFAKSSATSGDTLRGMYMQRDKYISNKLAQKLNLPIAKWGIIQSKDELQEILDKSELPIVIKPTGLSQGKGVTTNIKTLEQAERAYEYAYKITHEKKTRKAYQYKVMYQEQVQGDDYRILVVGGKFKVATKRVPAFVIGDGKSTVKQLIEETNKDPRRDMSTPAHILKPIKFDEMLTQFLEEQNLSLEYTPKNEERVYVRKVASMSQGGMTEDATEEVHPQIKYLAESLAATMRCHVVGIDVICSDISTPLTKENGSFIEMNTMPEIYLNLYPTVGKQRKDVAEDIVMDLIEQNDPTIKIVVVGKEEVNTKAILENNNIPHENERIGEYHKGKVMINGEIMREDVEFTKGVESLKINSSISIIVIRHSSQKEVKENGLGFVAPDLIVE